MARDEVYAETVVEVAYVNMVGQEAHEEWPSLPPPRLPRTGARCKAPEGLPTSADYHYRRTPIFMLDFSKPAVYPLPRFQRPEKHFKWTLRFAGWT